MNRRKSDPDVHREPHLQYDWFQGDLTDPAEDPMQMQTKPARTDTDAVEHTVWDEAGLSTELVGKVGDDALTYRSWLQERIGQWSPARGWLVTGLISLAAGPWAVIGSLARQNEYALPLVIICVIGPLIEEIMKAAATLWVVEKRAYYFTSVAQVVICMLASGLCFAAIENMMYMIRGSITIETLVWRWTACVALHVVCALISGIGLARLWWRTIDEKRKPHLYDVSPYLIVAVAIHCLFNTSMVFMAQVSN